MTKDSLWQAYLKANPSFGGTKPITIKPSGLKKLFEQTWEYGVKHGQGQATPDIFSQVFGNRDNTSYEAKARKAV